MKASRLSALLVLVFSASTAHAIDRAADGYYHTGSGVRTKKVAFVHVKVYSIEHAMKELPSARSKQAVIDADVDKRLTWRMLRDVDVEKIQNALREGYQRNGYGDRAKIDAFVAAFKGDLKEGALVKIEYAAAAKKTTVRVGGSVVTVDGIDFMRATWSLWFGNIDQPSLSDELIARLP
jgi:hypothetical protein